MGAGRTERPSASSAVLWAQGLGERSGRQAALKGVPGDQAGLAYVPDRKSLGLNLHDTIKVSSLAA